MRLSRRSAVAALLAVPFATSAQAQAEKLPVVATFSILGDLVGAVGGEHVAVSVLVGPDGDAHSFAPTPATGRTLAGAKLVVAPLARMGAEAALPRRAKQKPSKPTKRTKRPAK